MRLQLIFFIGIFTNLLLAMAFPYDLLPVDDAERLTDGINPASINTDFGTNAQTSTTDLVDTLQDNDATSALATGDSTEISFLDSISNFFDGLFDALSKIAIYFRLLLPFGAVIGLLPGAIGFVLSLLYSAIAVYAIIQFIRSG